MTLSESDNGTGLQAAYMRFLHYYKRWGGHNYYGWDRAEDPRNYRGPVFWTESDCVFRFGVELEREFPDQVHTEFPIAGWTLFDYDRAVDKRQFVDLVVSDLRAFKEDGTSQERFLSHRHYAFLEAKYLPAGCSKTWRYDHIRKVESIRLDAERLARHLERGHCQVAAILVVDDDCLFQDNSSEVDWPNGVQRLIVSPRQLTGARGV